METYEFQLEKSMLDNKKQEREQAEERFIAKLIAAVAAFLIFAIFGTITAIEESNNNTDVSRDRRQEKVVHDISAACREVEDVSACLKLNLEQVGKS